MSEAKSLQELALSESGFVFDPRSGATFSVNPTGLALLRALQAGMPKEALAAELRGRCAGADVADVERDVEDFLRLLTHEGLLGGEALR